MIALCSNAKHQVALYPGSGVPQELTKAGGTALASSRELAGKADVVILMVPDPPDVESVLFGHGGFHEGRREGARW